MLPRRLDSAPNIPTAIAKASGGSGTYTSGAQGSHGVGGHSADGAHASNTRGASACSTVVQVANTPGVDGFVVSDYIVGAHGTGILGGSMNAATQSTAIGGGELVGVSSTHQQENCESVADRSDNGAIESGSIADKDNTICDFLVSLLECPVCFGYMMPPIMQCTRGHLICATCRHKLNACPVCRVPMSNIRNLAMEKVASKLIFPCKHACYGCRRRLGYNEKKLHEEDCEHRPYFCPYPDEKCIWQGSINEVYKHLVTTHESIITMDGNDIVFLATNVNLEGALDWTMIQSCFGRHFLLSLEKIHLGEGCQQYFAACRMIGSMRDASQFIYNISLEANNRTLKWQSKPRSIRESFVSFTSADFLVLNKSTVELFAVDGNLAINVIITKSVNGDE